MGTEKAPETGSPAPLNAYKITVWCESDLDEPDLASALEQGELWEKASNVQYQIDPARG